MAIVSSFGGGGRCFGLLPPGVVIASLAQLRLPGRLQQRSLCRSVSENFRNYVESRFSRWGGLSLDLAKDDLLSPEVVRKLYPPRHRNLDPLRVGGGLTRLHFFGGLR